MRPFVIGFLMTVLILGPITATASPESGYDSGWDIGMQCGMWYHPLYNVTAWSNCAYSGCDDFWPRPEWLVEWSYCLSGTEAAYNWWIYH